jgi:TetR/AcrR family transcriptional repressor of nem operon
LKVSKEKSAENRASLVAAAADLFAQNGIDGTGVADVCRSAGLTQGALYAHFGSKQALVADALEFALDRANGAMERLASRNGLDGLFDYYLSQQHCMDVSGGCAMAASASELSRQGKDVSEKLNSGFSGLVEVVAGSLRGDPDNARRDAIAIVTCLIGTVAIARGVRQANEHFSEEIISSVRQYLSAALSQ